MITPSSDKKIKFALEMSKYKSFTLRAKHTFSETLLPRKEKRPDKKHLGGSRRYVRFFVFRNEYFVADSLRVPRLGI